MTDLLTYLTSMHLTLLRGLWIGDAWNLHMTEVIVLAGLLVAGVLVSARAFRWE